LALKKRHPFIRFLAHLIRHPWQVKRHFSPQALRNIEQAIAKSEQLHAGEIRFVVEAGLHPLEIWFKKSPKARAIELFGRLNIWDTEHNNGVLIYLLLADRDVEIIGDRGIDQHIGHDGWEQICREMEILFRQGQFEAGVLQGIQQISAVLTQYFPQLGVSRNELSNKPILL
jgi:uncharacterized membrane protein